MIEKFSPNGACCRARSDRLQRVAMIDLTRNFYFVYGVLTIIGGVIGYAKAGSMASIIAGGISGALILVAAFLLKSNAIVGLSIGGVVALALLGRFGPAFLKSFNFMPAGLMTILSAIALGLTIASFVKR